MAIFFVVNKPSNLVIGTVSTSCIPTNTNLKTFVLSNGKSLDIYYRHLSKNYDTLLDIGELMQQSEFIKDVVSNGKGQAKPVSQRNRKEQFKKHRSRDDEVREWLQANPFADEYDLSEALHTGIVAGRAYLNRYGYSV